MAHGDLRRRVASRVLVDEGNVSHNELCLLTLSMNELVYIATPTRRTPPNGAAVARHAQGTVTVIHIGGAVEVFTG